VTRISFPQVKILFRVSLSARLPMVNTGPPSSENAHTAGMGVLGNLGGGFGEEPVRIGDLEAAARADKKACEEKNNGENTKRQSVTPAQRERTRH
jgi:hypothetical protein